MLTDLVCGVDEAGRGPLAGPVCAAAVILGTGHGIAGLADSKILKVAQRETLAAQIKIQALAWSVAYASVVEIDQLNILQASLLAMQRAVLALDPAPSCALIDGKHCPTLPCPSTAIVRGDAKVAEISAASILAKVSRDQLLVDLDNQFPGYGFAQHKGYPTRNHLAALAKLGPSPIHRLSFSPVKLVQMMITV